MPKLVMLNSPQSLIRSKRENRSLLIKLKKMKSSYLSLKKKHNPLKVKLMHIKIKLLSLKNKFKNYLMKYQPCNL